MVMIECEAAAKCAELAAYQRQLVIDSVWVVIALGYLLIACKLARAGWERHKDKVEG